MTSKHISVSQACTTQIQNV